MVYWLVPRTDDERQIEQTLAHCHFTVAATAQ